MGNVNSNILILILCVCLISGILSFFLVKTISIKFLKVMEKVNYKKLSIGIIALLTVLILLISGLLGFLIFVISTATGMYCISLNVKKTQMMGCLLIPTIILYLI
jgi:putative membrane protein